MSEFVESIRRLYKSGAIGVEELAALYKNSKINQSERDYILRA